MTLKRWVVTMGKEEDSWRRDDDAEAVAVVCEEQKSASCRLSFRDPMTEKVLVSLSRARKMKVAAPLKRAMVQQRFTIS